MSLLIQTAHTINSAFAIESDSQLSMLLQRIVSYTQQALINNIIIMKNQRVSLINLY